MSPFDTIAAVSTPYGKGGVALLRVSGPDAFSVCDRVFFPASKKTPKLSDVALRQFVYGHLCETETDGSLYEIDDGMAVRFAAPNSFTGEDTVEITCHGGILVTQSVLAALLRAGARQATAGEFTRRSFLAGKCTLTEAEALGALLDAGNRAQLELARSGMSGNLRRATDPLREEILSVLAATEAILDFPDEDLDAAASAVTVEKLTGIASDVENLARTYRAGHAVREGLPTVLCGKTNVGKSSLYNRLCGYEAAIVTDVAGTTRDTLREVVTLGKVTLRLCDTAGLRETDDEVESIGITRSEDAIRNAELVLAVFDGSSPLEKEDRDLLDSLKDRAGSVVVLINKTDKGAFLTPADFPDFPHALSVSAGTGDGLDSLTSLVESLFIDDSISLRDDAVVTDARQMAALSSTADSLREAVSALSAGEALDIVCTLLENAASAIGEVDGRTVNEEIVSRIFSRFCVGK